MSEPKLFWYNSDKLRDPIAIVGLPSIGLVGSITSSFLARELKLGIAAGLTYPDIQQYAILQDGEAYPPVRFYAGPMPRARRKKKAEVKEEPAEAEVSKPKKRTKVRDIIVVTSEVAAKPEFVYDFTCDVLDIVASMGTRQVIIADGIPNTDPASMVMGAYSNEGAKQLLEENGIPLMKDGIVRGFSGVALYKGKMDGLDVVCIVSPANPQLPDPRAAATLLEPLSKMVPRLDVDPMPLYKEADEIEGRVRAQQAQQPNVNNQDNLYG